MTFARGIVPQFREFLPSFRATARRGLSRAVTGSIKGVARRAGAGAPLTPRRPLTPAEQWAKLASILNTASVSTATASSCQAAALQQLDLAQYALSKALDELANVMMLPARKGASATLYALTPSLEAESNTKFAWAASPSIAA